MEIETDHERLYRAITVWIESLDHYPGWREWKRKHIGQTLFYEEDDRFYSPIGDFTFTEPTNTQHAIITAYMALSVTLRSLRDCEYYFRRFPFNGLPVSHHTHLTNICEMYFSRFYQFKIQLKNLLNLINSSGARKKLNVGKFLKLFDKEFDAELRERNKIHHHEKFETIEISQVFMNDIMTLTGEHTAAWRSERRRIYRKVSSEWANRVVTKSKAVDVFLNATAQAVLSSSDFLKASSLQAPADEPRITPPSPPSA